MILIILPINTQKIMYLQIVSIGDRGYSKFSAIPGYFGPTNVYFKGNLFGE